MEIKFCNKCSLEKPIDDFENVRQKNGEIKKRGTCRKCRNEIRKSQNKGDKKIPNIEQNGKVKPISDNPPEIERLHSNIVKEKGEKEIMQFTTDEVTEIKELLEERRTLLRYNENIDKSKRTVKTFNIDNDLLSKLEAYAKLYKISSSDALNTILSRGFIKVNND